MMHMMTMIIHIMEILFCIYISLFQLLYCYFYSCFYFCFYCYFNSHIDFIIDPIHSACIFFLPAALDNGSGCDRPDLPCAYPRR